MTKKIVRAFSISETTLEELKALESSQHINLSKFVDCAIKEKLETVNNKGANDYVQYR